MDLSWTAAYFPSAGQYNAYHTYRENRTIFGVSSSRVSYGGYNQSTKYTYLTRPYNSTNIMFEIRDITLDDAGYYNGGSNDEAAWSGGGVVLIVHSELSLCYALMQLLEKIVLAFIGNVRDLVKNLVCMQHLTASHYNNAQK